MISFQNAVRKYIEKVEKGLEYHGESLLDTGRWLVLNPDRRRKSYPIDKNNVEPLLEEIYEISEVIHVLLDDLDALKGVDRLEKAYKSIEDPHQLDKLILFITQWKKEKK